MATTQNSSTAPAPDPTPSYEILNIWLSGVEVSILRAEQERRNAERMQRATRMHQVWRALDLTETAELMLSEVLKSLAEDAALARTEGGAQ